MAGRFRDLVVVGASAGGVEALRDFAGGLAIVQDPDDALYPAMPANAMARVAVDHVVPAVAIGRVLAARVRERVEVRDDLPDGSSDETA